MKKAQNAYLLIGNETFGKKDIVGLGDNALTNQSIFSKKIMIQQVSANKLPGRLKNALDPSYLPYPFVFSPSRKACLQHLLPTPKETLTIIEGFSQAGKSNLACHLALIYRMKTQNSVVFYIGNMNAFQYRPFKDVKEEMFYWFYEEIERNLMAQTIMSYLVKIRKLNIDVFEGDWVAVPICAKQRKKYYINCKSN